MVDFKNVQEVKGLKQDLDQVFNTPQGKNVLKFMQELGGWYPTVWDSRDTNDIIYRDANRQLLGTIRTILDLSPEQIVALAAKQGGQHE